MLRKAVERVRERQPLIHGITNYVTINDCANILLACGGSPIMAEDVEEVEEVTAICDGLVINIGTLLRQRVPAMVKAGQRANELGHPVVLDPVGAGISGLRTRTALELMEKVHFSAIRGNASEIRALVSGRGSARGVDADPAALAGETLQELGDFARRMAAELDTILVITGEKDLVADGDQVYLVSNGHPMLGRITGSGCQLSALITAYLAANPEDRLMAVLAAVSLMGVCGEKAHAMLSEEEGTGTFRRFLLDAVYCTDGAELERLAKYERIG